MMGLPLAFAEPLVLLGLLSLPVLWWLLRLIPPRPRRITFPPTRLLFDIAPKEETPSRTPWWLLLLRLLLAALLIIAAAGPLWNPPIATSSNVAPIALLIDDGWSAAAAWDKRIRTAQDLVARAETNKTGVAIVPLSEAARDISLETPGAARVRLDGSPTASISGRAANSSRDWGARSGAARSPWSTAASSRRGRSRPPKIPPARSA